MSVFLKRRTRQQQRARLNEIQEHGFIERWEEVDGRTFLVYAPCRYGPYTLKEMDAWLEGIDAMGVGGVR
jgi:hypothetical protein